MIIEGEKKNLKWPPSRNGATLFETDDQMKKVCLFSNRLVVHCAKLNKKDSTNKGGRKNCSMCSRYSSDVGTRHHCSICLVSLCCNKKPGFELSCFDEWHTTQDLIAEWKLRKESVESSGAANRAAKRSSGEAFDGDTDESGLNGDEMPPLPPLIRGTVDVLSPLPLNGTPV